VNQITDTVGAVDQQRSPGRRFSGRSSLVRVVTRIGYLVMKKNRPEVGSTQHFVTTPAHQGHFGDQSFRFSSESRDSNMDKCDETQLEFAPDYTIMIN